MAPVTDDLIYPSNPPREPILALILSLFLLGGVGQLYLGQTTKGIILIVLTFFTCGITAIVGAIDAFMVANTLKNGKPVGKNQWFPS